MSTGQWIGAILGAIVGFIVSGFNPVGLVYGAIIGYAIGGYIDPVKPDVKQPGAPTPQGLQVMTNVIGNPIFDVLGTAKITGQLLFFGKEFNRAIWYRPSKGVRAISGYKYYASWGLGICIGPVDELCTVFRDQDPIWEGSLIRPASGGEATIQISGMGTMVFYFGTDDQNLNTNAGTLLPDSTLNTGQRHLCWAFFDACFINEYNRMPSMSFVVRKNLPLFSQPTSRIALCDTNPAHAIWHILINKAGLPEAWVHSADFLTVATTLYNEERGISILFDTHQPAISYIEAINDHVDNILRYGSDGKFHPKLIRNDYTAANLPLVNESILLEEPSFSRRSWIDTINEVKIQYSEITGAGERITVPLWSEMFYDNFYISSMAIDSSYIYICGSGFDGEVQRPKVGKVDIMSGALVSSFMHPTNVGSYVDLAVDGDGLYVCGSLTSPDYRAITERRDKNVLSSQVWSYTAPANPSSSAGISCEGSFIYSSCGTLASHQAAVYKLNKSDGTVVWYRSNSPANRDIFVPDGGDFYLNKEIGGWNVIGRVLKSNGDEILTTFTYGWPAASFGEGNYLWVGGRRHELSSKTIVKYLLGTTPVKLWGWEEIVADGTAYVRVPIADNNGVYGVGCGDFSPPFILKLNSSGTSKLWEIDDNLDPGQRVSRALCQLGNVLYIGTYYLSGTNYGKGRISKRSKSDGLLTTALQ